MFRSIPVSNKLCFDKQIKRNWKIHQQKIYQMKSNVSKQKPQQFTFLQPQNKRNVLQDIKNRQIQRSNHILYKKIQQICEKGPKNSLVKISSTRSPSHLGTTYHEPFRKKQLTRIYEQNQDLIKRLRDKKSMYSIKKMQKQRKQIQKNISLMSSYQYKDYPMTQTFVNFYVTSDGSGQLKNSRFTNKNVRGSTRPIQTSQHCKMKGTNRDSHRQFITESNLFHSSTKNINYKSYEITTYLKKNKFYVQVVNSSNHTQKYRMQMSQSQVLKILSRFYDNKIQNLVQNIQIDTQSQSCYLNFQKQQENLHNQSYD